MSMAIGGRTPTKLIWCTVALLCIVSPVRGAQGGCPVALAALRESVLEQEARGVYMGYLPDVLNRPEAQPLALMIPGYGVRYFHNREVMSHFRQGVTLDVVERLHEAMRAKGTLTIASLPNGAMPAATRGSYGQKAWDRDSARIVSVEVAERDPTAYLKLRALSKRMAKPHQFERIMKRLTDPMGGFIVRRENGKEVRDAQGELIYDVVIDQLPQVIFDPHTLGDYKIGDQLKPWSAQKDAWGLYLHMMLDGLESGLLNIDEMINDEEGIKELAAFVGMAAMLVRIKFWKIKTDDAWEEEAQKYTSGMGIVTGALERFADELSKGTDSKIKKILLALEFKFSVSSGEFSVFKNIGLAAEMSGAMAPSSELKLAITEGYKLLRAQLAVGEAPHMRENMGRRGDTSLLFLFYYRLKDFSEADYQRAIDLVKPLIRDFGMLRYEGHPHGPYDDLYLNPAFSLEQDKPVPRPLLRYAAKQLNREDPLLSANVMEGFRARNSFFLSNIFGNHFFAQWSLGLGMLVQACAKMARWFPESPKRSEWIHLGIDSFVGLMGMVSPGKYDDLSDESRAEWAVALDGGLVPPWVIPESITRANLYNDRGGVVTTVSVYSENSPLKWGQAETKAAFTAVRELLQMTKVNP